MQSPIRRPARFNGDSGLTTGFGPPLSEIVLEVEPGNCIVCGKDPHDAEGGVFDNPYVEDGVMKGETTCIDCLRAAGDPVADEIDSFDE